MKSLIIKAATKIALTAVVAGLAMPLYALSLARSTVTYPLTAPTYGAESQFIRDSGKPDMVRSISEALYEHGVTGFGTHQELALQADYLLHTVDYKQARDLNDPVWIDGNNVEHRVPWRETRHANLCLLAPRMVSWTVSIPPDATNPTFHTSMVAGTKSSTTVQPILGSIEIAPADKSGDEGSSVSTAARPAQETPPVAEPSPKAKPDPNFLPPNVAKTVNGPISAAAVFRTTKRLADANKWFPVDIPLQQMTGRKVKITLDAMSTTAPSNGYAVFAYPSVTYDQAPSRQTETELKHSTPENTELSSDFPKLKGKVSLNTVPEQTLSLDVKDTHLRDYQYLYMRVKPLSNSGNQSLKIGIRTSDGKVYPVTIPLLSDDREHQYTYPLRLIEPNADVTISKLEIAPVSPARVSISEVALGRTE